MLIHSLTKTQFVGPVVGQSVIPPWVQRTMR